jgi:hypothetical protein
LNRVTSDVAMANEPLPLPDIAAEPPLDNAQGAHDLHGAPETHDAQDAEYEAICAEITATERGRWFLSEHVKRSGAADRDRLVGSLARAEAAMRGDAAAESPGALADDLAKLAAAIGQVEAVMAAGASSAADGLAASERIQDVAFALRERRIDPALCDELESALFELGDAFARQDAAAERTQSAAALLRGVEANINALIALVTESAPAQPALADAEPPASVADAGDDSLAAEPLLLESVSNEPAPAEPVETPPAELELTGRPGAVTPSMWETVATSGVEAIVNEFRAPRGSVLEDGKASEESADNLRVSDETVGKSLFVEPVVDDALSPTLSEATVVSAPPTEAGSPRDEEPSSAATDDALPLTLTEAMVVSESPTDIRSLRDGEPSSTATDDALPWARSEEAVVSELEPDAGLLSDEAPSSSVIAEQSSEESTNAPSALVHDAAENEVEPALQLLALPADLPAEVPANDESTGIIEPADTRFIAPAEDGVGPSVPDALEPTWSADDDIESLLEAEPADPLPTATQPAAVQEDLDDLFEPLPPELDVQQAAGNAIQPEARQQTFSPELPPPAFSTPELRPPAFAASAMQIGAQPAEPPSVPVVPAAAARPIPHPAPNDPLAAVRALSAEKLIALFS